MKFYRNEDGSIHKFGCSELAVNIGFKDDGKSYVFYPNAYKLGTYNTHEEALEAAKKFFKSSENYICEVCK